MKRRNIYKYASREEALVARRERRNRAQKERRHHARKHELAAFGEKIPQKQCVEVVRRRSSPSNVQSREGSGAGLKTAAYGRHCMPLGKSGNPQRFLLRRPSQRKKNPAFLPLEKNC